MLEWPWTQRLDDGKLHIVFSPNMSIYMNSGYGRPGNTLPDSKTSRKMYAVKDIMKDEEIITKVSHNGLSITICMICMYSHFAPIVYLIHFEQSIPCMKAIGMRLA